MHPYVYQSWYFGEDQSGIGLQVAIKNKEKTAAEYISLHDRQAGQNKHVHMYKIYLWKYLQLKISTNITLHKLHNKAWYSVSIP